MGSDIPPFSPFLFVGMGLRPLPPRLVTRLAQRPLDSIAHALWPRFQNRLDGLRGCIAVIPTDMPYGLLFDVADNELGLELIDCRREVIADATVRAPTRVLLDMMRGDGCDGDASFFNRSLVMEGNTELSMALRYALEEAELDPVEVLSTATPLPLPLARRVSAVLAAVVETASDDVARMQSAILAPLAARVARGERRLAEVEEQVAEVLRTQRRRNGGRADAA